MLTTRFWGVATVLLCALLLQDCQSSSLTATEEEACDEGRCAQEYIRRDTLSLLLGMAGAEPDKAAAFLEVSLTATQDKHFCQQALGALGKVAQASPWYVLRMPPLPACCCQGGR
jgi:hypothetical protein